MKRSILLLLAFAALFASAKDKEVTLRIDTQRPARAAFPCGVPCVGYATDPIPGDESAALACRRAGAWIFRTGKGDDATFEFCAKYGLRIILVLEGSRKEMGATLTRIAKSPHRKAVAGIQLGADPSGGADPSLWRHIAAQAVKKLRGISIFVPVKDLDSPMFKTMHGYFRCATHLIVDLRDTPAPYEKVHRIAERLRDKNDPDKALANLRIWTVAPGRLAGTPDDRVSTPTAIAWQFHWVMSALTEDLVSGVLVDRPYLPDDFGRAMRHLWAATTVARSFACHGEGATAAKFAPKPVRPEEFDLALEDESLDKLELNDPHAAGPPPVACAKVVQGKPGDVEYVAFVGEFLGEEEGRRVSVFLVNTTGERVQVKVDVNRNGGHVSKGFRRRLVPDPKTGRMTDTTRERRSWPLCETVEPLEVTFFDFRIF